MFVCVTHGEKMYGRRNTENQKKVKRNGSVEEFNDLLERTMLSTEEKQILILYYKEQKTLTYIADFLGMSEITVKRKHKKLLMKIGKLL